MTVTIKDNQVEVVEEMVPAGTSVEQAQVTLGEHDLLVAYHPSGGSWCLNHIPTNIAQAEVERESYELRILRDYLHPERLERLERERRQAQLAVERERCLRQIAELQEEIGTIDEELLSYDA